MNKAPDKNMEAKTKKLTEPFYEEIYHFQCV